MKTLLALMIAVSLCVVLATPCAAAQQGAKEPRNEDLRISGVVVDALTGAAVAGAELLTDGGDVQLKAVADGEGRFTFEGVGEGKYPLSVAAPGYVRQGYNQHGSFFTRIAVGNGLDSEHIVFKLQRQAVIFGRVTDERGDAVRRADVMLFVANRQLGRHGVSMQGQIQTNDEGAYRFAHLLPGKYYVGVMAQPWWAENGLKYQPKPEASAEGFGFVTHLQTSQVDPMVDVAYPVTYFGGATEESGAVPLTVKAGDAIEATVRLIAVAAVHVLLSNLDDVKREGQNVNVFAVQRPFGATTMAVNVSSTEVSLGVYEVDGLPPGEVRLMVNRGGDAGWDTHGIRLNAADGEQVDANARTTTSSVSGVVVPPDGSEEEMQGEVTLRNAPEDSKSARLRKDGTFSIPGVEEGTYEVAVSTQESGDYVAKLTGSGAKITGKSVKIEGASDVKLTVAMGRGLGHVTGVARIEEKPTAGLMVLLVPEAENLPATELEQSVQMDQSDSDGTFSLKGIVPGKYVLMAIEDGWELEWREAGALNPYREKGLKLEVAAQEEKKVVVDGMKKLTAASQ